MGALLHPRSGSKVSSLLNGAQLLAAMGAQEPLIDRWLLLTLKRMAAEGERAIGSQVQRLPFDNLAGDESLN